MKWGKLICIHYTRGDICVKFAIEAYKLALSTLDQLSLNLHNALVRRKIGENSFPGVFFRARLNHLKTIKRLKRFRICLRMALFSRGPRSCEDQLTSRDVRQFPKLKKNIFSSADGMGKCQSLRREDQGWKREREKAMDLKNPDVIMQSWLRWIQRTCETTPMF